MYCALRLNLPRRTRRRVPPRFRHVLVAPTRLNEIWALDFMHDALYGGRRFRTLNVIDEGNREGLAIEVGVSIPASRVVRVLDQLIALYGRPAAIRIDNGPELTSQTLTDWAIARGITLIYIQPGKPVQNAFIERFNRTYREEVLNAYLFHSTAEAQALSDAWLVDYNEHRPHDALGRVPPLTYLPRVSPRTSGEDRLGRPIDPILPRNEVSREAGTLQSSGRSRHASSPPPAPAAGRPPGGSSPSALP